MAAEVQFFISMELRNVCDFMNDQIVVALFFSGYFIDLTEFEMSNGYHGDLKAA